MNLTEGYHQLRQRMVGSQLRARGIHDARVLDAMGRVPRHEFVPPEDRAFAYEDRPLPIGFGQTISQPYMVALMCELLEVGADHRVLEVGAGSGYQAGVLGLLAAGVWAVEIVPQLAERARETLDRLGWENVHITQGDGSLGHPAAAPYDRIVLAAGAPAVPPPLLSQLQEGGKLVAPVGDRHGQTCIIGTRRGDELVITRSIACGFVPLVGEHGWRISRDE